MRAAEIRETYLAFFEQRGHRRMPSASLVPAVYDASVLLTTAGMQPFKPYFRGEQQPPSSRLTSVQKCFRTTDIDQVGSTARHLTMFEMLGNFSFGDYFKREAIEFGFELATDGFDLPADRIWITVFGGDDRLGLGEDTEAIEFWSAAGVPDERIVRLGRADNFWQAGPTGPCGPCSELYLDRGLAFGGADDRPGDDSERFLEFWNLVFMQYELHADGALTELPARNIDTGMGLDRMAAILQDKESVFETDHFRPLIDLAEELSGRGYADDTATTKAMRVLADHGRAMAFLIADGVVPSNEDRGYILRRIMRRAIHQGRVLGIDAPLGPLTELVIELLGDAYPELGDQRASIANWTSAEQASFSRTLEQGTVLLDELIAAARDAGTSWIDAGDAFRLHDTFGFPYDLTRELLAEAGLSVDDAGFEELMEQQRERARSSALRADPRGDRHQFVQRFVLDAPSQTEFVGYDTIDRATTVVAVADDPDDDDIADGDERATRRRLLVKLAESPFYAEGGGQVADGGVLATNGVTARIIDVYRMGDDQALRVEIDDGDLSAGAGVRATVDRAARHATATHHTATHLLHAALRERLGDHVRQAGSSVRPDKLRFDFTHGHALTTDDIEWVERRVNGWIFDNHPVRAIQTTRADAERRGAMALFGEKYGDRVRMVEVGDGSVSRELCGGTHVATTAEIGCFLITAETSSAANVRRIEGLSGPAAVEHLRERDRVLRAVADALRTTPAQVPAVVADRAAKLRALRSGKGANGGPAADGLAGEFAAGADEIDAVKVVVAEVEAARLGGEPGADALRTLADAIKGQAGSGAVVAVACVVDDRAQLIVAASDQAVARGVKAGELARVAADLLGGGGGGRDTMAQAGGRAIERLPEALEAVRAAIGKTLAR